MHASALSAPRRRPAVPRRRLLLPLLLASALLLAGHSQSTAAAAATPGHPPAASSSSSSSRHAAFMSPAGLLLRGGYGLLRSTAMLRSRAPLLMMTTAAGAGAAAASASQPGQQGQGQCASKPPCARVVPVPILSDNYAYLVIDPKTGTTACVDPAEPEKLLAAAKAEGVSISTLLCTHKHWDHAGGNEALKAAIPSLEVVTTKFEDIPAATLRLGDGDRYALGSLEVTALYTPCHTKGHVLFYVTPADPAERAATSPVLFSGDTLFVGGCGRFFEGDGAQMAEALLGRVARLPPETLVYCGHEYTQSNLAFAAQVEPGNAALRAKIEWAARTRAAGGYTVPSTVGEELTFNPFMRVTEPAVVAAAQKRAKLAKTDPAAVMSALREWKNNS